MPDFTPEPAQSTELYYGSASGAATTAVTNLLTVRPPNQEIRVIRANTLSSTRDVDVISNVQGNGDLMFSCQHSGEQTGRLKTAQDAKTLLYWKVELPDTNGTILVPGYLLDVELDISGGPESIPEVNCTVRCTGDETFTAGS